MKRTAVFVFVAFCAVSALSSMVDENKSKPSATVSPASEFGATSAFTKPAPTTTTNTTTTTTNTTTTTATTTNTTTTTTNTTTKPTTTTTTNTTTTTTNTTTKPAPTTTTNTTTTTTNTTTTTATTTNTTTTTTNTTTKPTTTTTTNTTTTTTNTTTKPTTTTTTNTTTTKPTTTTTNTTTHATTTTTTPATTTTKPTPTQPTNLTVGNYSLKKDNMICLMAQMALQIRLATPQLNGTFIVQPHLTKTQGGCQETTVNFTIAFKEGFINFMFNKSTADNTVYVDALSFELSYPFGKGGNGGYSANNQSVNLFAATIGHSYSCKAESLYMGNGLYLDVNQDRMQAFNLKNNIDFGTPDPCAADRPDYRVAIAVGVTLLVLIVIVVIAYLLGRKRRTDGYQSL